MRCLRIILEHDSLLVVFYNEALHFSLVEQVDLARLDVVLLFSLSVRCDLVFEIRLLLVE